MPPACEKPCTRVSMRRRRGIWFDAGRKERTMSMEMVAVVFDGTNVAEKELSAMRTSRTRNG